MLLVPDVVAGRLGLAFFAEAAFQSFRLFPVLARFFAFFAFKGTADFAQPFVMGHSYS